MRDFTRRGSHYFTALTLLLFVLAASAAFAQIPKPTEKGNIITYNVTDARYCEFFLLEDSGGQLSANVYNTIGLNICPEDQVKKLDGPAIAKEYKAKAFFLNGPRYFVCDELVIIKGGSEKMFSTTLDFGGIKARLAAHVLLPPNFGKEKNATAYKPTTVHRNNQWVYNKGNKVFLLDDPDKHTWVMQASSAIVDPNLTPKQLPNLGSMLKPAPGWSYRVVTLDKDLTVQPVEGTARIVQDELQNTYDQCFDESGHSSCTFKP